MSRPFDPPAASRTVTRERIATRRWASVVGAWGLATTAVGTAIGVTIQILGTPDAAARLGIFGLLAGLGTGALALVIERAQSARRPELVDGHGISDRPLHGALLGVPIALALPASLWLVVIVSVAMNSAVPAVLFGLLALALAFAGLRVWAQHRLTRALEALAPPPNADALASLRTLAQSPLSPKQVRMTAQLSIAFTQLQQGQGLEALGWFEGIDDGEAAAWATTGRAMASLLLGQDPRDAEAHLAQAFESPYANAVRAQADAVRILVLWRREGSEPARTLAEALRSATATPLHLALLARLREQAGDLEGAQALTTESVEAFLASGLGRAIPELGPKAPLPKR
ncbi:MAG: hypothetical protein AAGA48_13115 [Myxococcota bacterium]